MEGLCICAQPPHSLQHPCISSSSFQSFVYLCSVTTKQQNFFQCNKKTATCVSITFRHYLVHASSSSNLFRSKVLCTGSCTRFFQQQPFFAVKYCVQDLVHASCSSKLAIKVAAGGQQYSLMAESDADTGSSLLLLLQVKICVVLLYIFS